MRHHAPLVHPRWAVLIGGLPSAISRGGALLAVASVTACGGDKKEIQGPPPPETGTIALAPLSDTLELRGDSPIWFVATITRAGGFTGPVQLSVAGITPTSSVSVQIVPNPIPPGATTSVVTMRETPTYSDQGPSNFPDAGPFTISAHASAGVTPDSKTVQLLTGLPHLGFRATPASLTIQSGSSGTMTLWMTREERTDFLPVFLNALSATEGFAFTFDQSVTTAPSAILTIAVAATVPAGAYTVQVRAIQRVGESKILTVPVTVTK